MLNIRFCTYPQQPSSRYVSSCLIIEMPDGPLRIQDRHLFPMLREGKAQLMSGTVHLTKKPDLFKLGPFS